MASKRKSKVINEQDADTIKVAEPIEEKSEEKSKNTASQVIKVKKAKEKTKNEPKYKIGSIVYISKDADADLNGFKLFPQYKKYTYTVEAYDGDTGVYSLRRLNLSLKLKEADIVAPSERSDSSLIRRQF